MYFACGKGRSSTDAVWKQAVVAEGNEADGLCSATALWDMIKFYESFCLERLRVRALVVGLPPVLMQVCYNTYRGVRLIRAENAYKVIDYAKAGLPAGCVLAYTMVCVY